MAQAIQKLKTTFQATVLTATCLQYLAAVLSLVLSMPALATNRLSFVKAVPIEGPANLNPSGLAYCSGAILLVSDKIDRTIYELRITENSASLQLAIVMPSIPGHATVDHAWTTRLVIFLKSLLSDRLYDWEGITCDPDGNILLLSETYVDIAKVSQAGEVSWLNTSLLKAGKEHGLFQINNAYAEGIALLDDKTIVVAAERQPRGLAVLRKNGNTWNTEVRAVETSPIPPKPGRTDDFSGLAVYGNTLYSLERNASAVCARNIEDLKPIQCWSYAHVEEATDFRYQDNTYGLGEGIVFTDQYLFIVLDNNGDARLADAEDRRAQLFVFEKPALPGD
jgi:hypothetical protein